MLELVPDSYCSSLLCLLESIKCVFGRWESEGKLEREKKETLQWQLLSAVLVFASQLFWCSSSEFRRLYGAKMSLFQGFSLLYPALFFREPNISFIFFSVVTAKILLHCSTFGFHYISGFFIPRFSWKYSTLCWEKFTIFLHVLFILKNSMEFLYLTLTAMWRLH